MKIETIKPYGVPVSYSVTETAEEFDALAGSTGATHDRAVKQELYHGSYGDIRAAVTAKLEFTEDPNGSPIVSTDPETGEDVVSPALFARIPTETKEVETPVEGSETGEVTTETVVTKWETDAKFFDRVCSILDVEPDHFADLIQEAADESPFDPSKKERVKANKKVAKTHLAAAQEIADEGALEGVASALTARLGIEIDVSDPDTAIENLGRAIAMNEAAEKKALADKYKNLGVAE